MKNNPETSTPYSRAELTEAFNKVCNKDNWKLPIRAEIETNDQDRVHQAVIFFTGDVPNFKPVGNTTKLKVVADGYYAVCGA